MPCVLRVAGAAFDVHRFLRDSPFAPVKVWKRGEERGPGGRRGSRTSQDSGFNLDVSAVAFEDSVTQIKEAIAFLATNRIELARLMSFSGVESATLDFGLQLKPDAPVQSDYVPPELLRLAGELGIGVQLSRYAMSTA